MVDYSYSYLRFEAFGHKTSTVGRNMESVLWRHTCNAPDYRKRQTSSLAGFKFVIRLDKQHLHG